jgi:N-acetylmuramoyl-L-alanine amidase
MPVAMPEIRDDFAIEITEERVRLTREYFRLHNAELHAGMPPENTVEAIRFAPQLVLVHYTVIPTLEKTVDYFASETIDGSREVVAANGALNVGVQFIVDRDGTIYRSYPENVMSRHVIGLNHVAIGIENVGNGDLEQPDATAPLTHAQLDANVALIRYLAGKYPTIRFVVGHHEYQDLEDPKHPAHDLFQEDKPAYRTEKEDPGKKFMEALRKGLRQNNS